MKKTFNSFPVAAKELFELAKELIYPPSFQFFPSCCPSPLGSPSPLAGLSILFQLLQAALTTLKKERK
jgi:hypothetical protein